LPDGDIEKTFEYYGLNAYNLNDLFPELVYDEENTYSVNYSELIPVCINSIKDVYNELQEAKDIISSQQASIDALIARLDAAGI
jgi:hypothetical protein